MPSSFYFNGLPYPEEISDADIQEKFEQLRARASTILDCLLTSSDFQKTFVSSAPEQLHVLTHSSHRIIVLDALTKCSIDEVANFDTYYFSAHPSIENKIAYYTRSTKKPNDQVAKSRSWDVGLNVILKVEALDKNCFAFPFYRLLFREFKILKHLWDSHLKENMELDDMTGIPMAFDYIEVPNIEFNYETTEVECQVLDIYGRLIPWKSDNPTTLSYMIMEKMGPSILYLQELMHYKKQKSPTFDLQTSFKVFDQLICRLLQIHRLGVVHNSVEPRNIYFGRLETCNVVYLGNYSKSFVLDSPKAKEPISEVTPLALYCDPRYSSQFQIAGAPAHPLQDIECAFYILLNMILAYLPWDIYLIRDCETPRNSIDNVSNSSLKPHPKIRQLKMDFWKSSSRIHGMLQEFLFSSKGENEAQVSLGCGIIKDIYIMVRKHLQSTGTYSKAEAMSHPKSERSAEWQFYIEIRRRVLMFFRFESISDSLLAPSYLQTLEALAQTKVSRPAWNLSDWCFNVVLINATLNQSDKT